MYKIISSQAFWLGKTTSRIVIASLIVMSGLLALSASAHQLQRSNNMGVMLHIEPTDTPLAGEPTEVRLYFTPYGSSVGFNITTCDCKLTVRQNGQIVTTAKLVGEPGSGTEAAATIQFPRLAVYSLDITGQSPSNRFAAFNASFVVRVDQLAAGDTGKSAVMDVVIFAGVAIISGGVVVWWYRKNRRVRPHSKTTLTY